MSLKPQIDQAFASLVGVPSSASPQSVRISAGGNDHLAAELVGLDTIGCATTDFALMTARLKASSNDQLLKLSNDLSKRLSYLLEPISPIEIDADGCTVQMRSTPPSKDAQGTSYYELLVKKGGELRLRRYNAQPGQPRGQIPAEFTRQVFCRLADDFAAAVAAM